jgi:hypothetical protein
VFIGSCACYAGRNLRGDEIEKAAVLIVETKAPTKTGNQETGALLRIARFDRDDQRLIRGI